MLYDCCEPYGHVLNVPCDTGCFVFCVPSERFDNELEATHCSGPSNQFRRSGYDKIWHISSYGLSGMIRTPLDIGPYRINPQQRLWWIKAGSDKTNCPFVEFSVIWPSRVEAEKRHRCSAEKVRVFRSLCCCFTYIQHIVRTYDSRQPCLWSAEQRDQMKIIMRHTRNGEVQLPKRNSLYFSERANAGTSVVSSCINPSRGSYISLVSKWLFLSIRLSRPNQS